MAVLEEPQKLYLVRCVARYMTPTEAANALKQEFGVEITPTQAQTYDPTAMAGRNLGPALRAEFETERKRFRADIDAIPCSDATYRLNRIQQVIDHHGRNPKLVLEALEQAAKEVGGSLTNKLRVEVDDARLDDIRARIAALQEAKAGTDTN